MNKARARELIANERARLERLLRAEMAATAPDLGDEVDDANWRIAEETGRAVSRSLRDRWSALERAEERLARGTYGRSVLSGEKIPDERLEADPLAELTVQEAASEAFKARRAPDSVSGLSSTRRTLAALAKPDEEGGGDERRRGKTATAVEDDDEVEEAEVVAEEDDDLEVEELDEELVDDEDSADFEDEDEEADEAESESEDGDAEEGEEQAAEERPARARRRR